MIYFLLPGNSPNLFKNINYIDSHVPPDPFISNSLSNYLYDIKEKINEYPNEWDVFKRYTNPFEYIHTAIPIKRKCISKYKPLSRSYFKMIEIITFFHLLESYQPLKPIKTFHLAEGPGGFIEAIANMRKQPNDEYVGMTILDEDITSTNIPAWKKSVNFLRENPNVCIETGKDGTGDILSIENFKYCSAKYKSSIELITADGGFDFSVDFNNQEVHIAKLLFAQMAFALCMQKRGGSFVLKIFDCFMLHTLDILSILSSFYGKTYITKPQTSRYANSEKYVVCKDFLFDNCDSFYPFLYNTFEKMIKETAIGEELSIYRFLTIPLSCCFISRMEEFNAIFGQQQIENIHYTISLIENKHKNEKTDNLIKINMQKCINWCIKYNVQFNNIVANNQNAFLQIP